MRRREAATGIPAGTDVGGAGGWRGLQVLNNESGRLTPSMVAFGAKQRFKGCIAGNNITTNPTSTINMLKRLVGRQYADPQVQADLDSALYKSKAGPDGGVLVQVDYLGELKEFTPEQVTTLSLSGFRVCRVPTPQARSARAADTVLDLEQHPGESISHVLGGSTRRSSPVQYA